MTIFALAISHRPGTPPTASLVLPGFWLLFTATLISAMSTAVGVQTWLLLWRAAVQLTKSPDRRAFHD